MNRVKSTLNSTSKDCEVTSYNAKKWSLEWFKLADDDNNGKISQVEFLNFVLLVDKTIKEKNRKSKKRTPP